MDRQLRARESNENNQKPVKRIFRGQSDAQKKNQPKKVKNDESVYFKVEKILERRQARVDGRFAVEFLVQWEGFQEKTWEGMKNLRRNCPGLLKEFMDESKGKSKNKKTQAKENVESTISIGVENPVVSNGIETPVVSIDGENSAISTDGENSAVSTDGVENSAVSPLKKRKMAEEINDEVSGENEAAAPALAPQDGSDKVADGENSANSDEIAANPPNFQILGLQN